MNVLFWQIVIEGIAGQSYQGDIAIDDIKLVNSPCPLPGDFFVLFISWCVTLF